LENAFVKQRLTEQFGEQVNRFEEPYGMLSFESPKEMNLKLLQFLFDDPELRFSF
jgi:NADH-quinone oxidoreductase subunit C